MEIVPKNEDQDSDLTLKTEDLDDPFVDAGEISKSPKKSRAAPKSSQPAADDAALMYDGTMEAI